MSVRKVSDRVKRRAAEVGAAFLGGEAPQSIADRLGMDRTNVYKLLKYEGISPSAVLEQRREATRQRKQAAVDKKKRESAERRAREAVESQALTDSIVARYREGESVNEIAAALGVSRQRVDQRLKSGGVSARAEWEYRLSELEFLCGTDSFDGLCERLRTTPDSVYQACTNHGRLDLYWRLAKTRIIDYTTNEDKNAA